MTSIATFLRRFNFNQMNTPAIMRLGQQVGQDVSTPELAAMARWSLAIGFLTYWMVEPNFEDSSSN